MGGGEKGFFRESGVKKGGEDQRERGCLDGRQWKRQIKLYRKRRSGLE